jgi:3-hydroxyisobutyrate dehydrogenase
VPEPHLTVGWIGLGHMGTPMAGRLADAGYAVRGHDADAGAAAAFAAGGVNRTAAGSAAAAATGADVVVLMLPSSAVVQRVTAQDGLLDAMAPGALLVDMGSSEPTATRELAEAAAARGVRLVDAPVSGGVLGAERGTLTIMVGGEADDVARLGGFLDTMGGRVLHVGPVAAGHALKALNNLLSATHLLASAEALEIGVRFGLDATVLLDAINTSSGRSGSTEKKLPDFVLPGTYDSGFGLALMLKDMRIALGLAAATGVPAPLGHAAVELWALADAALAPGADHTEIARWVHDAVAGPKAD